jgi:hypothetical protein
LLCRQGFDKFGYNRAGFDKDGYDKNFFDKTGYNKYVNTPAFLLSSRGY